MIKKLGLLLIAAVLSAPGWAAGAGPSPGRTKPIPPKEENIGVGSGAAVGAIAGGPLGLIAGVALGGWLGDRFHKRHVARVAAQHELAAARADAHSLAARLDGSERRNARLQSKLQAERHDYDVMLQRALDTEILFPTAQSRLSPAAKARLAQLAQLIKAEDGLIVVAVGHADARGTSEYNEQLSAARAASVRAALIAAGVPAERITTRADGEEGATAGVHDVDALALERRVHVTLVAPRAEGRVAQD